MARGFILDLNRCTGCDACRVACAIENGLEPALSWRRVRAFNPLGHPAAPRFHLSLACNHCADPPCAAACPALAIVVDPATGAVSLDRERCIGCRYCAWACPYDAPVYDPRSGEMAKCTLCLPRLSRGGEPACVTLCPTGALRYAEPDAARTVAGVPGFPQAEARPAIRFTPLRPGAEQPECGRNDAAAEGGPVRDAVPAVRPRITPAAEWPLLAFTLLAPWLVALWTSVVASSVAADPLFFFSAVAAALAIGAVHLGRPARAWRAALNLRRSWLSREVALYVAFAALAGAAALYEPGRHALGWAAVLAGFAALYSMDRIYDVARMAGAGRMHSADVMLTGLLVAALLLRSPLLGGAMLAAKLFLYLRRRARATRLGPADLTRGALRLGLGLLFPAALWLAGPRDWLPWALAGVAVGECIDRWEFYRELDLLTPERQLALDLRRLLAGRSRPALRSRSE